MSKKLLQILFGVGAAVSVGCSDGKEDVGPGRTIKPISENNATTAPVSTLTTTQTVQFNAVADAFVNKSYPKKNYNNSTQLISGGSPVRISYIKFDVKGLSGTVSKATLKLYSINGSADGPKFYRVTN